MLKHIAIKKILIIAAHLSFTIQIAAQLPDKIDSLIADSIVSHNIDTIYKYSWVEDLNQWMTYEREIVHYNKKKDPLRTLTQKWNTSEEVWTNTTQEFFSYDKKGNEQEKLVQTWRPSFNNWVNTQLKTSYYNNFNERKEILFQEWQKPGEEWINTVRYIMDYNMDGLENNIIISKYNSIENEWSIIKNLSCIIPENIPIQTKFLLATGMKTPKNGISKENTNIFTIFGETKHRKLEYHGTVSPNNGLTD